MAEIFFFHCLTYENCWIDIFVKQIIGKKIISSFQLLLQSILPGSKPKVESPLGRPPFEKPSIAKGVTNFVLYKFNHLPPKDWQTMYDLAKMFLHCLNHWNLETPRQRGKNMSAEDLQVYKNNFARWVYYSHVPEFCDSLTHFDTTN